jgi:hypothetical protein
MVSLESFLKFLVKKSDDLKAKHRSNYFTKEVENSTHKRLEPEYHNTAELLLDFFKESDSSKIRIKITTRLVHPPSGVTKFLDQYISASQ